MFNTENVGGNLKQAPSPKKLTIADEQDAESGIQTARHRNRESSPSNVPAP